MRKESIFRAAGVRRRHVVYNNPTEADLLALTDEVTSRPSDLTGWLDAQVADIHRWMRCRNLPTDRDELAHEPLRSPGWYASEMLWEISLIRNARDLPPADFTAVMAGIRFGALMMEAQIEFNSVLVARARQLVVDGHSANQKRKQDRVDKWARWNREAADVWMRNPNLTKNAVARLVKDRLDLREAIKTIAPRLRKN